MLALPWRKYSVHDFVVHGTKIVIVETPNDPRGTGLIVWDGAFVLGKFLENRFAPGDVTSKGLEGFIAIELGAGTGLAGLAAAALGASSVYLTDLDYALENLQANVDANQTLKSRIKCAELDWFKPDFSFLQGCKPDLIVLADVAWVVELIVPLVATVRALCDYCLPKQPEIFLAHQTRAVRTDEILFAQFAMNGFTVVKAEAAEHAEGFNAVPIYKVLHTR